MEKAELIKRFEAFLEGILQKIKSPRRKLDLLKPVEVNDGRFVQWRRK